MTSQQTWSKQLERKKSLLPRQFATRSSRQENGQPCGPSPWSSHFLKKANLQRCQNYRMISLISLPSKVMLKIILDRMKPQAEKIIAEEQAGFRAPQSRFFQPENPLWETSLGAERHLPCLCRLKGGLQQGFACSFLATMKKYNIGANSFLSHQTPLWQSDQYSPLQQQHRRLVLHNSCSPTGMSSLTYPLQHISGNNDDRCLRRSWRHCQD